MMTETEQVPERYEPEFSSTRTREEETWRSISQTGGDFKPTEFTRVQIAVRSGARVFGVLRETGRGGIQVLTTIPVPVRCPLEIALEGCRPVAGEAFYSIKRSSVFLVGIIVSSRQKPNCAAGSLTTIRDLEAPLAGHRGTILEVGSNSLSVLSQMKFAPGAWVRLESRGWILFGVVGDVVPTTIAGHWLRVQVEAAFRADLRSGIAIPETHILRSFPKLQPWTRMDREHPLQGELL